jgi:hypothetical protein
LFIVFRIINNKMMETQSEIDVYNLHKYTNYEMFPERCRCTITWDMENEELHTLMKNENSLILNSDYYTNSLWVNEMKRTLSWELGKSFTLSMYYITLPKLVIYETRIVDGPWSRLKIDEEGYLLIKKNDETSFERCNCLYNSLWEEENSPYIMK